VFVRVSAKGLGGRLPAEVLFLVPRLSSDDLFLWTVFFLLLLDKPHVGGGFALWPLPRGSFVRVCRDTFIYLTSSKQLFALNYTYVRCLGSALVVWPFVEAKAGVHY